MWLARTLRTVVFASISLGACSCALLFQGTTEEINVASDPPGASVTLNDGETKVTPFAMTSQRNKDLQFHFSKAGYQSTDMSDNSKIEPGFLVVDAIPLLVPWAIDEAEGAGFTHQETSIVAHLDPELSAAGDVSKKPVVPLTPPTPSADGSTSTEH